MGLAPGTQIGPYEVAGQLGAGGMGEVYDAEDTRLKRRVALKVLPTAGAADPDRQRRFETEARAIGALSHANILAIFDVGEHEGAPYLVTEKLEGATLRDRLGGQPLPTRRAVDWGHQIAEGLAAAHDRGVIHRDLKPENLFVTRDGHVKILDFGLAKARPPEPAAAANVTLPAAVTAAGVVFGTVGYMAPEQVRGQPVDHRADIFALGAILYEMLSGRRAFEGESSIERAHAILKDEPPPFGATLGVPPALELLVRRCLEKAPDERYRSAHDLAYSLKALKESSGPSAPVRAPRRRPVVLVLLAGMVLGAGGAAVVVAVRGHPRVAPTAAPGPVTPTYRRVAFRRGWIGTARFAPDGRTIVYAAGFEDEPPQIFSGVVGTPEARALGRVHNLFGVSSSGELAVVLRPEAPSTSPPVLARVPLAGGAPREVQKDVLSADWSPDGRSLAVVRSVNGRARLEFPIGAVRYETAGMISSPRISPRGDQIAFFHQPIAQDTRGSVTLVDLAGGHRTLSGPWPDQRGLAWSSKGDEIWFTASKGGVANRILAVSLTGTERVILAGPGLLSLQDIAPDGRVLLRRDDMRFRIAAFTPNAGKLRDLSWFDGSAPMDLSRDGKKLLFVEGMDAGSPEVISYLRPTDGGPAVRLGEGWSWALSPDGAYVLNSPRYPYDTLQLLPTGAGDARPLPRGPLVEYHGGRFFPDGQRILLLARDADRQFRLWVQDLSGGVPRPVSQDEVECTSLSISPDGQRLAVTKKGDLPVFLPATGGAATPIPGLVGEVPVGWTADGRGLFVSRLTKRFPIVVSKLDLATGRKIPWKELQPDDAAGASSVNVGAVTPDGRTGFVSYIRLLSDLYVVEGLR
jgi:Tol biopolymer transport system component